MQQYIALLRGINVSGQKIIPMAALRDALSETGFSNIQTYIQSGNIYFESLSADLIKIKSQIENIIQEKFGFQVPVLVLLQHDLQSIPALNPFYEPGCENKPLYVGFMYDQPTEENIAVLEAFPTGKDEFVLAPPFVFMKFAQGMGKSKMDNNFFERKLKVGMTTRNWNTVVKLSSF